MESCLFISFQISFSTQLDLYEAFRSLRIWFSNSFPWKELSSEKSNLCISVPWLVQIDAWVPSLPPKSTNWLPSTAQALPLRRCNMGRASCKQCLKLRHKISFVSNLWPFQIELFKIQDLVKIHQTSSQIHQMKPRSCPWKLILCDQFIEMRATWCRARNDKSNRHGGWPYWNLSHK